MHITTRPEFNRFQVSRFAEMSVVCDASTAAGHECTVAARALFPPSCNLILFFCLLNLSSFPSFSSSLLLPLAVDAGLDARAAAIVMRTVRNIVNTGRTIVCTIHQPSIDIFEAFDELLLLKRGGECIFNGQLGKDSGRLIDYFSVIQAHIVFMFKMFVESTAFLYLS